MSEYANFHGSWIKVGTCHNMYYLRYEDRFNVTPLEQNINIHTEKNIFWRLPFPDEDHIRIGNYKDAFRSIPLYKIKGNDKIYFEDKDLALCPGQLQVKHKCGLLVNIKCYHGIQLPAITHDTKYFWNGKSIEWFHLTSIKNTEDEMRLVIKCIHCGTEWSYSGEDKIKLLEYIPDEVLKNRIIKIIENY